MKRLDERLRDRRTWLTLLAIAASAALLFAPTRGSEQERALYKIAGELACRVAGGELAGARQGRPAICRLPPAEPVPDAEAR